MRLLALLLAFAFAYALIFSGSGDEAHLELASPEFKRFINHNFGTVIFCSITFLLAGIGLVSPLDK